MTDEVDLGTLGARAVLDLRGRSRVLGTLWRFEPAVIIWLRHFACIFCKQQASDIRREKAAIEALGARLAFIGSGSTRQARGFADEYVPDCAVFTDPSAYTYRTLGARDSMVGTVTGLVINGPRAMRRGHFQTRIQRRTFQSGGVLVALPENRVAYLYLSRIAGDHPPNAQVLGALRAAGRHPTPEAPPVYAWSRPDTPSAATAGGPPGGSLPLLPPPPGLPPRPPEAPPHVAPWRPGSPEPAAPPAGPMTWPAWIADLPGYTGTLPDAQDATDSRGAAV